MGGKIAFGLGAAALGAGAAKKHPLGMLAIVALGAAIGHMVDTNVLPNCPSCKVALQLIDRVV